MNAVTRILSFAVVAMSIVVTLCLPLRAENGNTAAGATDVAGQHRPGTTSTTNRAYSHRAYTTGPQYARAHPSGQPANNVSTSKFPVRHGRAWKTCRAPGYGPSLGEGITDNKPTGQSAQPQGSNSQQQRSNYIQEFHWPARR